LVACEEGLEMLGVVVFLHALTSYLESIGMGVQLFFRGDGFRARVDGSKKHAYDGIEKGEAVKLGI
jgi:hypothetical protein